MGRLPDPATAGAGGRHGFPWRAAGLLLVALLALAGFSMVVAAASHTPQRPPQPALVAPQPGGLPAPGVPPDLADPDSWRAPAPALARSEPTRIRIPQIGVDARVTNVGVDAEGVVEVPDLKEADQAAWYELGPSPGELGNSVVVGHVDSYAMGPAVFFRLGALTPGAEIEIERQDGRPVRFRVDQVASYPTQDFPHELVYGPADRPQLRLVTCGGEFNEARNSYPDNVIVFATMVDEPPPAESGTPTVEPTPSGPAEPEIPEELLRELYDRLR